MDIQDGQTYYQAAEKLIREIGHPLSSIELANRLHANRRVQSNASHPERSIANTIDQAINNDTEKKSLVYITLKDGTTVIGLPEWKDKLGDTNKWWEEIRFSIHFELYRKLQLALQAEIKPDLQETIIYLLESGLKQEEQNIRAGVMKQLERL